ncbi:hypothetical protein LINGRAHAP2_LOCUS31307 [Linum grandiflorum]
MDITFGIAKICSGAAHFAKPSGSTIDDNSTSGVFQKHRPLRINEPASATIAPSCPSPDSVLKCLAEVLSELNETEAFRQSLIEEQHAIAVDPLMQNLSPTVQTLMKASRAVADDLKTGVDIIRHVIP